MKRRLLGLMLGLIISQNFPISSAIAGTILPLDYEFSSSYGIDLTASISNVNSDAIDMVPGDTVLLEVNATLSDTSAMDWPTEVEFFALSGNLFCRSDEEYFSGSNYGFADMDFQLNEKSSKAIANIKLPKICERMTFQFQIKPMIQEITLEGNSNVTGSPDLDDSYLTPETSDEFEIGEIRNHLNILRWPSVKDATLAMKKVKFTPKASAGKVRINSMSKSICVTNGDWILFARAGICNLVISVESAQGYDEIKPVQYSFAIVKAIEIQCVKNDKLKLVTGSNPKCPAGFRKA